MKANGELPDDTTLRNCSTALEDRRAAITIAGIELLSRIQRGQFNIGRRRLKDRSASDIWNAVLAAS
jgi:hypothetical protein